MGSSVSHHGEMLARSAVWEAGALHVMNVGDQRFDRNYPAALRKRRLSFAARNWASSVNSGTQHAPLPPKSVSETKRLLQRTHQRLFLGLWAPYGGVGAASSAGRGRRPPHGSRGRAARRPCAAGERSRMRCAGPFSTLLGFSL